MCKLLTEEEIKNLIHQNLKKEDYAGKRILVIIPDHTRSGPTGLFFKTISEELSLIAKKLDFIIALGTHPPLKEEKINKLLGISAKERRTKYKNIELFNHCWDDPSNLQTIGKITHSDMKRISGGLMNEEIPVQINKRVFEYDRIIISGPVFPHEVVGFSGGYKYLFPGIAGPEIIHRFHWLGALITNIKINGVKNTPVREVVNKSASFIKIPIKMLCYVIKEGRVHGLYIGGKESWSRAADLSEKLNIEYKKRKFHTVLAVAPPMYEDLWTAGKCMYKLEPVVEDGGRLIIYAPHIKEVSFTHGKYLFQIGYHTRDYFLKQMDKFRDIPGGILAHSTHVKGIGTYVNNREVPRINVILATGIPKQKCKEINLDYMDPFKINVEDYANREDEGILLVRKAGEVLYRRR